MRYSSKYRRYIDPLTRRLFRPNARFVREAVFGILTSRSTLLSNIGRALKEPHALHMTEKRLSRMVGSDRMDDSTVEQAYLRLASPLLRTKQHRRPTIAVDTTDIRKPRARKMPALAKVWDGSESTVAIGYNVIAIEAVGDGGRRLPLLWRLFSSAHENYRSETTELDQAIAAVRDHVPNDALWVFDRGFDGRRTYGVLRRRNLRYVVRLNLRRTLWVREKKYKLEEVAASVRMRTMFEVNRVKHGSRRWVLRAGWVSDAALSGYSKRGTPTGPETYVHSLVVVKGIGPEPLILLTNVRVTNKETARTIVEAYLDRWGAEEAFRFVKSCLDLENLRALTWRGLCREVLCVFLAYGFLAVRACRYSCHSQRVAASARAFGPVPDYVFYRLLEAVRVLLRDAPKRGSPCHRWN